MEAWELLKFASDPTRLRILRLVDRDELSVNELQEILDMGQSRISTHLSVLRNKAGVVCDRKDGKRTFYRLDPSLNPAALRVLRAAFESLSGSAGAQSDDRSLERVLEKRRLASEQYFNEVAGRMGRHYSPGRSWEATGHFLLRLMPHIDVADLGAGEAMLSRLLARRARQVWCVDHAREMVRIGTEKAQKQGISNLTYVQGDIEEVPLPDASVDLALLSQALHHARSPSRAISEAWRILRPGGMLAILDLRRHNFEAARELYADVWLGFSENDLYDWMAQAGFSDVEVSTVATEPEPPHFETLLATGTKKGR